MTETPSIAWASGELPGLNVSGYRETPFFSTVEGQLCQWIELDLANSAGWRTRLTIEIHSGGQTARRTVVIRQGEYTLRAYAPAP